MEEKHNISIDAKLYTEIKEYCQLNGIKLNVFVEGLLKKAFAKEKFGEVPFVLAPNDIQQPKIEPLNPIINESIEIKEELPIINVPINVTPIKTECDIYNDAANIEILEQKPIVKENTSKKKITKLK